MRKFWKTFREQIITILILVALCLTSWVAVSLVEVNVKNRKEDVPEYSQYNFFVVFEETIEE